MGQGNVHTHLITTCTPLLPDSTICNSLVQGSSERNNIPPYHVTVSCLCSSFSLTAFPAVETQKQMLCTEVPTEIQANFFFF